MWLSLSVETALEEGDRGHEEASLGGGGGVPPGTRGQERVLGQLRKTGAACDLGYISEERVRRDDSQPRVDHRSKNRASVFRVP